MNKQWKLTAGAAALAMSFGAQAGVIDLFSLNQGTYTDNTPNAADTGTLITSGVGGSVGAGDPTVLGGNRDLYVSLISNNGVPAGSRVAQATIENGVFDFSTSTLSGGRAQIQWDGAEATSAIDYTGLGSYDLTLGGTVNAFILDVIFSDAGFNFSISAYTNATDWTQVIIAANEHLTPVSNPIDFGAFGLPTGSYLGGTVQVVQYGAGVNLTNLGALVADIDQQGQKLALDLTLDNVTTVPEPGVLALMGMGLMAAGIAGRRRKSQA